MSIAATNYGSFSTTRVSTDLAAFDEDVLRALRTAFADDLAWIRDTLHHRIDEGAVMLTWRRSERHLFPILLVARATDVPPEVARELCVAFAQGFSIPILLLDDYYDHDGAPVSPHIGALIGWIYDAEHRLATLPQGSDLVRVVSGGYATVVSSALSEAARTFHLPTLASLVATARQRSICGFLALGVEAVLILAHEPLTDPLREIITAFGEIRQRLDDIADVEEDLRRGLLTLPVAYAIRTDDDLAIIARFWAGDITFSDLAASVCLDLGYRRAADEAAVLLSRSAEDIERIENRQIGTALRIFFHLKECLLWRLRANHWRDDRKLT